MAIEYDDDPIGSFDDWYIHRSENDRTGCVEYKGITECASGLLHKYRRYKQEMDARCHNFGQLTKLASAEVISPKPDLPNVSSGDVAGLVRRIARNLVQNTPNVEVVSVFDDDSVNGIFVDYILRSKIIGSGSYSNDMQQNLFASVKTSLTLGFCCVTPCLLQDASGGWFFKYDTIHHRDVFPEPGSKDIRSTPEVFVRRYLTKGEVKALIRQQPQGWDVAALKELLHRQPQPPSREPQSNSRTDESRGVISEGYEIVTWYSDGGAPFLTFSPNQQLLFRIEQNRHPLKEHPVFFLVLEKDDEQPLGKSQVELVLGRQDFQDLMLNGAMKQWYRNINPSIIGYGAVGSIPNLSPGKYTQISNPNARVEPFEVNTQTLLQFNSIAQANLGSMVNLVGSADQQMAVQAGNGMSATPQGVMAQEAMVDITTNNYQKAIEQFFSHYCSYALTLYFHELRGVRRVTPSADARMKLVNAGVDPSNFDDDGGLELDFSELAVPYYVRCVPGSLVEMEDEKQLRILNQLFVPLSQAMPALAAVEDRRVLNNAASTMQYIIMKVIELSGSNRSQQMQELFRGEGEDVDGGLTELENRIGASAQMVSDGLASTAATMQGLQEQIRILGETQGVILQKLGAGSPQSEGVQNNPEANAGAPQRM